MIELQDTDLMPFGKYKGVPMQDVPASYLHWLWTQDEGKVKELKIKNDRVFNYIHRNLSALRMEHKDGVW